MFSAIDLALKTVKRALAQKTLLKINVLSFNGDEIYGFKLQKTSS